MLRMIFVLLVLVFFTGCQERIDPIVPTNPTNPVNPTNPTNPIDPIPLTVQNYVAGLADNKNISVSLSAKAVIKSDVYQEMTEEKYPLLLILFDGEGTLERYLLEQGLTEENFLAHPKITEFVRSHLIYESMNLKNLSFELGKTVSFKSSAGSMVELKVIKSSEGGAVKGGTANGVPMNLFCADASQRQGKEASVCFADGPIVSDFDWSQ